MVNVLQKTLSIFLLLLMNTSCAKQEQENMEKKTQAWQIVKVVFLTFEGGFYGLVTENGKKLLPMNLAKAYKLDNTILKVKGNQVEGLVTIQQWGIPYNLSEVKLIKLGKRNSPNES